MTFKNYLKNCKILNKNFFKRKKATENSFLNKSFLYFFTFHLPGKDFGVQQKKVATAVSRRTQYFDIFVFLLWYHSTWERPCFTAR
jgi:hypothetical protein